MYPYKLERVFAQATEELLMSDNEAVLYIRLTDIKGRYIGIQLNTGLLASMKQGTDGLTYVPREAPGKEVKVVPFRPERIEYTDSVLWTPAAAGGFLIAYGTAAGCDSLIRDFRSAGELKLAARKERMEGILQRNPVRSNLDTLDEALAWLLLTTDELVTDQQGKGIYAGLPWFNEYWGRDMFISMPGAVLVNGQFETAKEILADFPVFRIKIRFRKRGAGFRTGPIRKAYCIIRRTVRPVLLCRLKIILNIRGIRLLSGRFIRL